MGYKHLTRDDRRVIQNSLGTKMSRREIATLLNFTESTISREISRNGGIRYCGFLAQNRYDRGRADRKISKWNHLPLLEYTLEKIAQKWSPEQISGRLVLDFPKDSRMRISFESIYAHLSANFPSMFQHLRIKKSTTGKRGRKSPRKLVLWGRRRDIQTRPQSANTGSRAGHWESDTVEGRKGTGSILTHVEKKTRLLRMALLRKKTAENVLDATKHLFKNFCRSFVKTFTSDRGTEFSAWEGIEKALFAFFYFANAYSPWQRGLNENTNGLIRQYFPKGSDFSKLTDEDVYAVQEVLNNRPRKVLGYRTSNEAAAGFLALQI